MKINNRYMFAIAISCFLILAGTNAAAWDSTGHMITAKISVDHVEPAVKVEVERLIDVLAEFDPKFRDIVPSATWMDEIKGFEHGLLAFNNWHFYNQPYNPSGLAGTVPPGKENVAWAIGQAAATIGSNTATDFEKALMLRMLIHFVGDAHQPLHGINRISVEHPDGDLGGNLFQLSGSGPNELHAFWDDTAGLFPSVDASGDWNAIAGSAQKIEDEVPESDHIELASPGSKPLGEWAPSQAQVWVNESYQHGVNTAYVGIQEGNVPSTSYTASAQQVVKKRLALGGYRLAAILNVIIKRGTATK